MRGQELLARGLFNSLNEPFGAKSRAVTAATPLRCASPALPVYTAPPTLRLLRPAAGARVSLRQQLTVRWQAYAYEGRVRVDLVDAATGELADLVVANASAHARSATLWRSRRRLQPGEYRLRIVALDAVLREEARASDDATVRALAATAAAGASASRHRPASVSLPSAALVSESGVFFFTAPRGANATETSDTGAGNSSTHPAVNFFGTAAALPPPAVAYVLCVFCVLCAVDHFGFMSRLRGLRRAIRV